MTFVPLEWSIECIRTLPMVVLCCVCLCITYVRIGMVVLFFQIRNYNIFTQRWQLFQSAALNCIIVSVDGRGTGFRGDK